MAQLYALEAIAIDADTPDESFMQIAALAVKKLWELTKANALEVDASASEEQKAAGQAITPEHSEPLISDTDHEQNRSINDSKFSATIEVIEVGIDPSSDVENFKLNEHATSEQVDRDTPDIGNAQNRSLNKPKVSSLMEVDDMIIRGTNAEDGMEVDEPEAEAEAPEGSVSKNDERRGPTHPLPPTGLEMADRFWKEYYKRKALAMAAATDPSKANPEKQAADRRMRLEKRQSRAAPPIVKRARWIPKHGEGW